VRLPARARSCASVQVRSQARGPAQARARVVGGSRIGVLGVDAGGTTGLCWWTGELKETIRDTLRSGDYGWEQVDCGRGPAAAERLGAERIARRWVDLEAEWNMGGLPFDAMYLVIEEFVIRAKAGSTQRVGLSSPRVGALVEGMLAGRVPVGRVARYAPARSKHFATSDRLKDWNLWCKSAPHSRDAAKQVALHVAVLLEKINVT
jgi:hypothetical protein